MNEFIFKEPAYLLLLGTIPVLWLLFRAAMAKRRAAMQKFSGTHAMQLKEQAAVSRRRTMAMVCYCVAIGVFVVALARPAWERVPVEAGSRGRDVLFLLDVSNSMRAEDLAPSRLERAKQSILDCVESLQGDRVGLVIFAGSPSIVCPLTTDYGFFRRMLGEAEPTNVSQGGTRIGDAIRKTVDKLLDEKRRGYQDLILITDGGDQDSQPEQAAKELEELGVFLVVVGLGDSRRGAMIPVKDDERLPGAGSFMAYKGQPVLTRLESAPLKKMAKASRDGVYLDAGLRAFHLGEVYHRLVEHFVEEMQETSETMLQYRDEFQWFVGLGLVALCLPPLFGVGRRFAPAALVAGIVSAGMLMPGVPLQAQDGGAGGTVNSSASASVNGSMAEGGGAGDAEGEGEDVSVAEAKLGDGRAAPEVEERSAAEYYNEGHRLYGLKLYDDAVSVFRMALDRAGADAELRLKACYNLGNSYFSGGEAKVATDKQVAVQFVAMSGVAFRAALDYDPEFEEAAWNLELARRLEKELHEALEKEREGEESKAEESESDEKADDGDPSEEGDEQESEDMEETDESGEGKPSDYSASDLALDLENEGLPPPMLDPEDIFDEEAANNELRQKKGNKYQAVEKDW